MLRFVISVSVITLVASTGCWAGSIEKQKPRPSKEITNSIKPARKPAGAPPMTLDQAAGISDLIEQDESAGRPKPSAPAVEPPVEPLVDEAAFVPPDRPSPMPLPKAQMPKVQMDDVRPMSDEDVVLYRKKFRDAKPINFGRSKPRDLAVHGVDVSRWQGNINWPKLRTQGANFAFIKATDGGDHLDPMFRKNWRGAHEAGLKRGAYHFFYWCRSGESQARWFIRNVPKSPGALPPVIDVEWNGDSACKKRPSPQQVRDKMQTFMDRLEAHYGQRPIIYTAPDFYEDNLQGAFPNHPFWLRAVAQHPSKVYQNRKWVFWQYSGSGLSHGVTGKIDLNAFHGSEDQWRQWVANRQH